MKTRKSRQLTAILILTMLIGVLSGCGASGTSQTGQADNDILTFTPNPDNKPIVRIGTQYHTSDTAIVDALNAKFPDYIFIMDYTAAAGTYSADLIQTYFDSGKSYDLVISGEGAFGNLTEKYFADLSGESFLNDYLLSSLNKVSVDGHIYGVPATSAINGIAYNADLFAAHGWTVPTNQDEFFALCEQIKGEGIIPFATCFKYPAQSNRLLSMMSYEELFLSPDDITWFNDVQAGKATYQGHMEPLYNLAKRFFDTGVITEEYYSASLTKQRQEFWEGKYAMIDYGSGIYQYVASENPSFEVGMMPYPGKTTAVSGYQIAPEYYLGIPANVTKDKERFALMKEVLAYFSTEEGQESLLKGNLKLSNLKGVDLDSTQPGYKYINNAVNSGTLYPGVNYDQTEVPINVLQSDSVHTLLTGSDVTTAIKAMDESLKESFSEGVETEEFETLATATKDFTVLETSYYLADKLKEATGADVGLMLNNSFFRGNLAMILKGEVTSDLSRFVLKGMDADEYLTTYDLTGAQLRSLLENPVVEGDAVDALIASSGLKIEYAPWHERGSRVISLTLEDGTPLSDTTHYTVAAIPGVIDNQYITKTVKSYKDLGDLTAILEKALKADEKITPDIANRVKLDWSVE